MSNELTRRQALASGILALPLLVGAFRPQRARAGVESRLDDGARYRFVARSDALGDSLENALLQHRFREATEALEELHRLVCSLGALETEGMRRVLALAKTCGSAGKVSGAGGGDGVLLFSPDPDARRALLETLGARDIFALPMTLEAGLRGEAAPHVLASKWLG